MLASLNTSRNIYLTELGMSMSLQLLGSHSQALWAVHQRPKSHLSQLLTMFIWTVKLQPILLLQQVDDLTLNAEKTKM